MNWNELWEQLAASEPIWQTSLLQEYPASLLAYQQSWLDELAAMAEQEAFAFDRTGSCRGELARLLKPFLGFCQQIPAQAPTIKLAKATCSGLRAKKIHEIEAILSLFDRSKPGKRACKILDWAGGMGHLAARLQQHSTIPTVSIDYDSRLQDCGRDRYGDRVSYINADLKHLNPAPMQLVECLNQPHASVALHACGPLSLVQLKLAVEYDCSYILNLGCCFHLLSPEQTMISQAAKAHGFRLGPSALDLATRTRANKNLEAFRLKRRVNAYRWAVELFLRDELGRKTFTEIGRVADRIYLSSFAEYAAHIAARIQLSDLEIQSLIKWFHSQQKRLDQIFFMHLIRWQFSRPLELAVVGDRASFLRDHGFEVRVLEIFNPELSPRNLAILASH